MPVVKTFTELEETCLVDHGRGSRGPWSYYLFTWRVRVLWSLRAGKERTFETRRRSVHVIKKRTKAAALRELKKFVRRRDVVLLTKEQVDERRARMCGRAA